VHLRRGGSLAAVRGELATANAQAIAAWSAGGIRGATTATAGAPPLSPVSRSDGVTPNAGAAVAAAVRPVRASALEPEYEAAAVAAGDKYAGWVRPSELPSFVPLLSWTSSSPAAAVTPTGTGARPAGKEEVPEPAALEDLRPNWPLVKGRPLALTYLDAHLPEWDEEPAASSHVPRPDLGPLSLKPGPDCKAPAAVVEVRPA